MIELLLDICKTLIILLAIICGCVWGYCKLSSAAFWPFGKIVAAPKDFRHEIIIRDPDGKEYGGGRLAGHPARTAVGTVFVRDDGTIVVLNQNGISVYNKK